MANIAEFIFSTITDVINGFINAISSLFQEVTGAFYDSTNGLTLLGVLALLGFAVALVRWGFSLILRLIKMRKS